MAAGASFCLAVSNHSMGKEVAQGGKGSMRGCQASGWEQSWSPGWEWGPDS